MSTLEERREELNRIMATVDPVARRQLTEAYLTARLIEDEKSEKISSFVWWLGLTLACVVIYLMVVRVVLA